MAQDRPDSFASRSTLRVGQDEVTLYRLQALQDAGVADIHRLPFCMRVMLENLLRHEDGFSVTREDIEAVARWDPKATPEREIAFRPARVLLQDFTGVPAVVDLATMRQQVAEMGGDPSRVNPMQPVDLVVDHSVQVDRFGDPDAARWNNEMEFRRNGERYGLLRWAQQAFRGFRVVPPGTGIVHQINLEYLAQVVFLNDDGLAYPDTLVGTDSHTTMINGLGVVGWGVGGIEAEAAMLGQPISMLLPQVIGFRLEGELREGATATDLVLTVTQMLRRRSVVGKFVEYFGPGLSHLSLADRATLANMSPEYGATMGFFPVDRETVDYLRFSGRSPEQAELVEAYCVEQLLWRDESSPDPQFTDTLSLDLGSVEPSLAGPRRPQDRVPLSSAKAAFHDSLVSELGVSEEQRDASVTVSDNGDSYDLRHGSVIIAAITSCTNTSNPIVMVGAGLVAKKAVERGLKTRPWVKTSLAPGSKVVMDYLEKAKLVPYLEELRFHLVGYGCTTCIGNSGPLPENVTRAVKEGDLVAVSVLSGNRNFEGRINPHVRANYLASPPLVVAYALAGRMDIDLQSEPLGQDRDGQPVYLRDIWPTQEEIRETVRASLSSDMFIRQYASVFEGPEAWRALEVPEGDLFAWDEDSTYIRRPPFFDGMEEKPSPLQDIQGAAVLVLLGDSITTDHISPAGAIPADGPAGRYLQEHGVAPEDFNSFGSRRGNHEVMLRGTFGNIRLRNLLAPGTEGNWTRHLPDGEQLSIYDASMKYQVEGVPLLVIAGSEYGTGSSRDWAAKGTLLLGVKAVLATSFERIHRSNLIGMGVLPLQFRPDESRETLGLTGEERYDLTGIASGLEPRSAVTVTARGPQGEKAFQVMARVDTPVELDYYRHGGILRYVLRQLVGGN
ncbi:MAG: aconitate hydratase AcnA [Acidobacteria bacterium]|nr:MAG: aconitate hydratase AcnA [Acidobacteriota bacterium]